MIENRNLIYTISVLNGSCFLSLPIPSFNTTIQECILLHFFCCAAKTNTTKRLYCISFPYFFPLITSCSTIETGGEKKRGKNSTISTPIAMELSLQRLSTSPQTRWMSTLSSTKYQRSSRRSFLIMNRSAQASLLSKQ